MVAMTVAVGWCIFPHVGRMAPLSRRDPAFQNAPARPTSKGPTCAPSADYRKDPAIAAGIALQSHAIPSRGTGVACQLLVMRDRLFRTHQGEA